jgi:hypothetical protein
MSAGRPRRKPRCDRRLPAGGADGLRSEGRSDRRSHGRSEGGGAGEPSCVRSREGTTARIPRLALPLMPGSVASMNTGHRARKVDPPPAPCLAVFLLSRLVPSTTTVRPAAKVVPRGERSRGERVACRLVASSSFSAYLSSEWSPAPPPPRTAGRGAPPDGRQGREGNVRQGEKGVRQARKGVRPVSGRGVFVSALQR